MVSYQGATETLKVKGYVQESVKFDGAVRRAHKTLNRYQAFEVGSLGEWENGLLIDKAEALIDKWNEALRREGTEGGYYLDSEEEVVTQAEAK